MFGNFGGWQHKTAKLQVKQWSNGLDLTTHGSSLLLKDHQKQIGVKL